MLKLMMGGCLTLVLALGAGGFMAWRWWNTEGRAQSAAAVQKASHQAIDESQLSKEDKRKLTARVDTLTEEFKSGRLGAEDFARIMKAIGDSGVLQVSGVHGALDNALDEKAGTVKDPKKRAEAKRTLERFVRAVAEGKLEEGTIKSVVDMITETDKDGNTHFKDALSASEVDALVGSMKKAADGAKVPDEAYSIDYVGEITKIIDKALAERKRQ